MNFTSSGNGASPPPIFVPVHADGKVRHTSPSFCPAKGPDAKRHSTPVIHASPKGSARLDFSGNNGTRLRAPHGRGLKIGPSRAGHREALPEITRPYRRSAPGGAGLRRSAPLRLRKRGAKIPARRKPRPE